MTTLKLPGHSRPIELSDIIYLKGENNYTWFYLSSGQRTLSSLNLGYYEVILTGFVRIHKRVMVNPAYVASAERIGPAEGMLLMRDNTMLAIAKRRITTTLVLLRQRAVAAPAEVVS
jgi:two-component system LytT family response regulator